MTYQKSILPNGVRIIKVPLIHSASVTILVMIGSGSREDGAGRRGLAHFLEHMVFKGTKKRPSAKLLAEELDELGADHNAGTTTETLEFWIKCLPEKVAGALDVVGDIVTNAAFLPAAAKVEKKAVIEEIQMYQDDPRELVFTHYRELFYGPNSLGWRTAGTKESVGKLTAADLTDYRQENFRAENVVIGVVGKFADREVDSPIADYLGEIKPGRRVQPRSPVVISTGVRTQVTHRDINQTNLIYGFPAVKRNDPDEYPMMVLSTLLGGGISSRLFQEVREKRGLAYYIWSVYSRYEDRGDLAFWTGVDPAQVDKLLAVIRQELQKMTTKPVAQTELGRAKVMLKSSLLLRLDDTAHLAEFVLGGEVLRGKAQTVAEVIKKVEAVTAADIKRVAEETFRSENSVLTVVGPYPDKAKAANQLETIISQGLTN